MTKKLAAAVALVVAVALLVWWWRRDTPAPRAPAPAETAERARIAASGPALSGSLDEELPPPRVPEQAAPGAPIIDEIVVEKREICAGEESLVTVRAHTPGNTDDAHLHYVIAGQTGASVPVLGRVRDADDGGDRPPDTVMVFGRGNVATTAPLPPITVKDCMAPRRVHIHSRLMPNTTDEYELYAQVIDLGATSRMKPVAAHWTFGDGATAESKTPLVSHDYGARPQTSLYSQFLVSVEIVGADGERVRGRTSLQLMNPSFEHLHYRGLVLLRAAMTPRFPVLDANGKVVERVRVWHDHDQPVTLVRVIRRMHGAASAADADVLPPGVVFPSAVIGTRGIEATIELDTRANPDIAAIEYVVEGKTADGLPAQGGFTLMRPPDRPTRDHNDPVNDPALVARIVRARELLKQEFVTDEDLWRLEKEGAFSDLPPTGDPTAEGAPGSREPSVPPPPAPPGAPAPPPKK